jgi:hypothetical protein
MGYIYCLGGFTEPSKSLGGKYEPSEKFRGKKRLCSLRIKMYPSLVVEVHISGRNPDKIKELTKTKV